MTFRRKIREKPVSNPLTNPLQTLRATEEDIDEAYASAKLYREMAKNILVQNSGKKTLSHFEKNNLTRCLKRAAENESRAKRKEVSAATIKHIINIGEEAMHAKNLAKVIVAQAGLTKMKLKNESYVNKAIKRMDDIMYYCDKEYAGSLMGSANDIMLGVDPSHITNEAYQGLTDKSSAEEDLLADILGELEIEEPSMAAEAVMRCDKTKPAELPIGIVPDLPELPVLPELIG